MCKEVGPFSEREVIDNREGRIFAYSYERKTFDFDNVALDY